MKPAYGAAFDRDVATALARVVRLRSALVRGCRTVKPRRIDATVNSAVVATVDRPTPAWVSEVWVLPAADRPCADSLGAQGHAQSGVGYLPRGIWPDLMNP